MKELQPYDQLSEKEKDSDREWADKVLELIEKVRKARIVEELHSYAYREPSPC